MDLIEKLIEEMFTSCSICQGTGFGIGKDYDYDDSLTCQECDGDGKVLSYMGAKLIDIIRER